MGKSIPVEERFWQKVDMSAGLDACWEWKGGRYRDGYGQFHIAETCVASRVAWILTHGPIPAEVKVLHACDNPPCCNPRHLHLGDPAQNSREMCERGRVANGYSYPGRVPPERRLTGDRNPSRTHPEALARGEDHPKAKLTTDQVLTIRRRYAAGETCFAKLGREYGVSNVQARNIALRLSWKDV